MKLRSALVLVVLGAAALVAGWYFGTGPAGQQRREVAAGTPVFPDLPQRIEQAVKVEIVSGKSTLTMVQQDGTWVLPERGSYPVDQGKLRELLIGLTQLGRIEARTADPAQYARLGVGDPQGADATAKLVRVLDPANHPLAELIVGHSHVQTRGDGPESVYVRVPGQAQAWLAQGRLPAEADPLSWLPREIANIPAERVASVTSTRGEQRLEFTRGQDGMSLTAPADHPKLDQFKLDDVARALENLTLTDVKPAAQVPGAALGEAALKTTDGLVVNARLYRDGANLWLVLAASGDGAAKEQAAALQARVAGWAFEVGSFKEQAFLPTLDDLKADAPPAPAAGPSAPAPAPTPAQ